MAPGAAIGALDLATSAPMSASIMVQGPAMYSVKSMTRTPCRGGAMRGLYEARSG